MDTPSSSTIALDLTDKGVIEPGFQKLLNQIAAENVHLFDQLIDTLSKNYARDIDWWVSRPASRNTFLSRLFDRCMQLLLVQALLEQGHLVEVTCDSPAMAGCLTSLRNVALHVRMRGVARHRRLSLVRTLTDICSSLYHTVFSALAAAITRSNDSRLTRRDLTALDVFVLRDSFVNGVFQDRYFPELIDALPDGLKDTACYIPTFYRVRNYFSVFRDLRRSTPPFIVPEDFLRLSDYVFSFGHWWRKRRFLRSSATFSRIDISSLIQEDLREGWFARSSITALLAYRFWKGHDSAERPISRLINWYEGQDIDHAVAAAINWNAKNIRLVGFRPPCSRFELSVTPTAGEIRSEVVPSTMAVVGNGFLEELRSALPELHAELAPGLRYRELATIARVAGPGPKTILVTLPLAESALPAIASLVQAQINGGQRWLIKPHPATPIGVVERIFNFLPAHTEIVGGKFYDHLKRSDLVVGLESSALLEAIAIGVPAICLAHGNVPTKSPFPAWADQTLWRVCYGSADFGRAIDELVLRTPSADDTLSLRTALLSPADTESAHSFYENI